VVHIRAHPCNVRYFFVVNAGRDSVGVYGYRCNTTEAVVVWGVWVGRGARWGATHHQVADKVDRMDTADTNIDHVTVVGQMAFLVDVGGTLVASHPSKYDHGRGGCPMDDSRRIDQAQQGASWAHRI